MNDTFVIVFHLSECHGKYYDAQLSLLKFLEQQRTWFKREPHVNNAGTPGGLGIMYSIALCGERKP